MTSGIPLPWLGTSVHIGDYWTLCSFWHLWTSNIYDSRLTLSFLDSFILAPWDIVSLLRACLLAWSMSPHSQGKKRFTLWVMLLVIWAKDLKLLITDTVGREKSALLQWIWTEVMRAFSASPSLWNHQITSFWAENKVFCFVLFLFPKSAIYF